MTRSIVTVIAFVLVAVAALAFGGGAGFAPVPSDFAQRDTLRSDNGPVIAAPNLMASAMIVLAASDTDRGRPNPEKKLKSPPPAKVKAKAEPKAERVLPERNRFSDAVTLAALMAGGFLLGLAGFVFGRVWAGVITAGFTGLAIGAAVYAFAFASPVAHSGTAIAAALLIFSASALAPNLLGRAGMAAARRFFPRRQG